jgi:large subunit ribosomal protein L25
LSDQDITVNLEKREVVGKGLGQLRRDGKVPAVIHNHGQDSVVVAGEFIAMSKLFQEAGKSHPVTLKVNGDEYYAIIKEADFDPKKNRLQHVVFSTINRNEKVTAEVPIVFAGEEATPAERKGLIVMRTIDHVEIEALPKNLVDQLEVDGSSLEEVGDKLHISDIKKPEGVEILAEADQTIVTIDQPRAALSEESESEEAAEGEEGAESVEGADQTEDKSEEE